MSKNLIIYFSCAYENYAVGWIEKGSTEIIAEYVRDYNTCIQEAKARIGNAPIKDIPLIFLIMILFL